MFPVCAIHFKWRSYPSPRFFLTVTIDHRPCALINDFNSLNLFQLLIQTIIIGAYLVGIEGGLQSAKDPQYSRYNKTANATEYTGDTYPMPRQQSPDGWLPSQSGNAPALARMTPAPRKPMPLTIFASIRLDQKWNLARLIEK